MTIFIFFTHHAPDRLLILATVCALNYKTSVVIFFQNKTVILYKNKDEFELMLQM